MALFKKNTYYFLFLSLALVSFVNLFVLYLDFILSLCLAIIYFYLPIYFSLSLSLSLSLYSFILNNNRSKQQADWLPLQAATEGSFLPPASEIKIHTSGKFEEGLSMDLFSRKRRRLK